jgi:phosphatidate cytidylyltransferase
MNNLQQRVVTAIALGTLILGSIHLGPVYQSIVFGVFMVMGIWEFYSLCNSMEFVKVSKAVGVSLAILVFLFAIALSFKEIPLIAFALLFPLFLGLTLIEFWKKTDSPLLNISLLLFGIVYVVIPFYLSIDLNIRNTDDISPVAVMFILIWTNDTMAYFIGKGIGKSPFFPRISPKKTWEGTIGGVICTLIAGLIVGLFVQEERLLFWSVASLLISITAIVGDLMESLFKRSLQIKDSGKLLPGHGGILDRFDAALFSIPFFYCWYLLYFY